eukprot:27161_5
MMSRFSLNWVAWFSPRSSLPLLSSALFMEAPAQRPSRQSRPFRSFSLWSKIYRSQFASCTAFTSPSLRMVFKEALLIRLVG